MEALKPKMGVIDMNISAKKKQISVISALAEGANIGNVHRGKTFVTPVVFRCLCSPVRISLRRRSLTPLASWIFQVLFRRRILSAILVTTHGKIQTWTGAGSERFGLGNHQ